MGVIKDLLDLTIQLADRVKDRKIAAEIREIQRMVMSLASENAALQESRLSLMTENAELKAKVAALEKRAAEADEQSRDRASSSAQFVEHRGVLFKRKLGGGYHIAVYCPVCRIPLSSGLHDLPFVCSRCHYSTERFRVESIIKELPVG